MSLCDHINAEGFSNSYTKYRQEAISIDKPCPEKNVLLFFFPRHFGWERSVVSIIYYIVLCNKDQKIK